MNKFNFYANLPTERINKNTFNIDRIPLKEILKKLNEEDKKVPIAVSKRLNEISKAAKIVSEAFLSDKTVFFVGAGTSGRLGILEAAELVPTYGVKPEKFRAIIAGGKSAVFKAKEGAEDDYDKGKDTIKKIIKKGDVLIAIAASGVTPYVKGAMEGAKNSKAKVIFITCNPKEKPKNSDINIAIDVGPEPINGSTRMKSGTATKLVLNMITTSAMILSGKVYHNWMVDVKPTNYKLVMRAERVFSEITGMGVKSAKKFLKDSNYNVKTAVVMALKNITKEEAEKLIKRHKGFLKDILNK
ncbi:MAG: N-acetylmuramic acid 6-phosphate etherase [Elusimicrobiales bacterium]|jgi:N-acetylmuramic acid 6-phosphate etherase|nr:N-acetylmuramic acid 6-phosphate etherase [Elusimicrobiales bacterium]HOL62555.1 N-acetylmuramic acid 6-phosphate etherase [Elusimicrobiales bacterium]HPO94661.1 N-acetylmuramic acid 6-phosphate etherase [Elusimicrobiales bacterium]